MPKRMKFKSREEMLEKMKEVYGYVAGGTAEQQFEEHYSKLTFSDEEKESLRKVTADKTRRFNKS